MNPRALGYELRCILRTWMPPISSNVATERAFEIVRQLEEAAADALLDEVRRLGT